ncbi:MAG: ABC transporter ATP-binding protein [Candidatus Obscuribacterales bacterium]|nr:ABC transporter ATP-binding protein [Candidatus Obscuribacterales bacterium]
MSEREICIKIANLVKSYGRGRVRALDDVSLDIYEGEVFGLIGPNGAGKTTLMGCLLTLLRPNSGEIRIFGKPPDDLQVKAQSAFLPERPNFDTWMSGYQFMKYQHMLAKLPGSAMKQDIESALATAELDPSAWNKRIKKYSRGMLQRLGLAQMLLAKPRLCFLDEPGSGMDPLGANLLRNLLLAWKKQKVTVVLNSHHLDELERVCDRVAFIKGGRIHQIEEMSSLAAEQLLIVVKCSSSAAPPPDSLLRELAALLDAEFLGVTEETIRFRLSKTADKMQLVRLLVEKQVPVEEIFQERKGLEDIFISIHRDGDLRS